MAANVVDDLSTRIAQFGEGFATTALSFGEVELPGGFLKHDRAIDYAKFDFGIRSQAELLANLLEGCHLTTLAYFQTDKHDRLVVPDQEQKVAKDLPRFHRFGRRNSSASVLSLSGGKNIGAEISHR